MSYAMDYPLAASAPASARVAFIRRTYAHLAGAILAFTGVSWLADRWAQSDTSVALQYLGLSIYVVAEAVIFLPVMWIARNFYPDAIPTAGIITLGMFAGLTAAVFLTRGDYSHLYPILSIGSFVAIAFVIASLIFPFSN